MGAIGNLMFAIGFKVASNELTKANKQIDGIKSKTFGLGNVADQTNSKFGVLGKSITTVGRIAGGTLVAGIAGFGVAAYKAGVQAEDSFRIIKSGTGATGEQLDGLLKSYRNLGANVPDDLNTVAQVMADINTRTGATGPLLEDMSGKILSLTALTTEGADALSSSVPRMMGDWSMAADQGGATLDKLFVLSQQTGAGITSLAENLTKYGGPLRQLGFDFDTSAGLMAKWEKEGVNTELVAGSMRIALGKMAKDGVKDTRKAFDVITKKIQEAKTIGEATALSMEAFGAKAGPDMAAAIREGRFELGSLVDQIKNSSGAIDQTYADTETLSDKWNTFKNKMMIALEPIGKKMLDTFGKWIPKVGEFISKIASGIEKAMPFVESLADALGSVLGPVIETVWEGIGLFTRNIDILGPALGGFALVIGIALVPSLWAAATAGWAAIAPWLPIIAIAVAIGAAIAGVIYVFKNWGSISDWLSEKWNAFKDWIFGIFNAIGDFFADFDLFEIGKNILQGMIDGIKNAAGAIWDTIKDIGSSIKDGFCDFFGIKSPSRLMMEVGFWTSEGLAVGMEENNSVVQASEKVADSAVEPYRDNDYLSSITPSSSPSTVTNNTSNSNAEISPVFQISVNGGDANVGQSVAKQVEDVFESLMRRYGLVPQGG
ncbi:phage tail tape measure protein [Paenibacillus albiflavus]|uniref:Phage tail tape measure protein n=1 Tax=Paenibacillus albiflavus TaxID=2545760 RepID=A0A4R4EDD4_9BACL|nr:phage tail tape measure protein [Paenibacillus albiflavus]TCZ76181.1 phage tail tape measure protein [Paenibacillus albiflavus]